MASSLKERWDRDGPLTATELRAIDASDCAVLFGQQGNRGPAQELMALFAQAPNDLGAWLGGRYDDDPLGPVADADHSAARLVERVSEMPLFETSPPIDNTRFRLARSASDCRPGHRIPRGPGSFHDFDRLTIFADNLVPHVLRVDGLLAYDDELLARIERGELIPVGSPEEIEIRAVAVHAVERIVAELRASGTQVTAQSWTTSSGIGARRGVQGPPPAPNTHGVLFGGKRQDQSQRRQKGQHVECGLKALDAVYAWAADGAEPRRTTFSESGPHKGSRSSLSLVD